MKSLKNAGKKAMGLLVAGAVVTSAVINGGSPKASANVVEDVKQDKIYSYCIEGNGTGKEFDASSWKFKTIYNENNNTIYMGEGYMAGIVNNIHSDEKEPVIRLISGLENEDMTTVGTDARSGYATMNNKIRFNELSEFSVKFTISMPEACNPVGYTKGSGGDGIVFILTTNDELNGHDGGGIGFKGIDNSVAIELDSFFNTGNGTKYFDPEPSTGTGRKDHVAVIMDGKNTSSTDHIITSFLSENGYDDGFTETGSLTTYGEEVDTRLFTVWAEFDGTDLYVCYAKGDFESAVRPEEAQIVLEGSKDSRVMDKLKGFANQDVTVGFTSAIGTSKANHTVHSVAILNEYIEGGIKSTYVENYYVETFDETEDAIEIEGKKYVLVDSKLVADVEAGTQVEVSDMTEVYGEGHMVVDYTSEGYPSESTVLADGTTVVNQFFAFVYDVKINAEDEYYTGNPYDSAEITDIVAPDTDEEPVIYYEGVLADGTVYEKSPVPPTEVGDYKAIVTVGDVTAEDEFSILPVEEDTTEESTEEDTTEEESTEEDTTEIESTEKDTIDEESTEEESIKEESSESEDEEDINIEVPEAGVDNDDSEDETTESEDEEDIDIEVPEAAPGVDADANTGDSSNLTFLFVIMLVNALGLLVAGKKKASLSK